jgi:hypothetical protein
MLPSDEESQCPGGALGGGACADGRLAVHSPSLPAAVCELERAAIPRRLLCQPKRPSAVQRPRCGAPGCTSFRRGSALHSASIMLHFSANSDPWPHRWLIASCCSRRSGVHGEPYQHRQRAHIPVGHALLHLLPMSHSRSEAGHFCTCLPLHVSPPAAAPPPQSSHTRACNLATHSYSRCDAGPSCYGADVPAHPSACSDDPAIFSWNLMNEPRAPSQCILLAQPSILGFTCSGLAVFCNLCFPSSSVPSGFFGNGSSDPCSKNPQQCTDTLQASLQPLLLGSELLPATAALVWPAASACFHLNCSFAAVARAPLLIMCWPGRALLPGHGMMPHGCPGSAKSCPRLTRRQPCTRPHCSLG